MKWSQKAWRFKLSPRYPSVITCPAIFHLTIYTHSSIMVLYNTDILWFIVKILALLGTWEFRWWFDSMVTCSITPCSHYAPRNSHCCSFYSEKSRICLWQWQCNRCHSFKRISNIPISGKLIDTCIFTRYSDIIKYLDTVYFYNIQWNSLFLQDANIPNLSKELKTCTLTRYSNWFIYFI